MPPGQIFAKQVVGKVSVQLNGATTDIKNDDAISQASTVITAKESSVVLVFSNGATVQLGAETTMVIEQFLQDPFAATLSMADLVEEPTTSKTKLHLMKGELVGKVAHLKRDQGSEFTVQTPVGAAGIRGTTFRIVFRPSGTGQAFAVFSLSTVEGQVLFQQGAQPQGGVQAPGQAQQPQGGQGQGQGQGDAGQGVAQGQSQGGPASPAQGQGGSPTAGGPASSAPPSGGVGGAPGAPSGSGVSVATGQEVVVTLSVTVNQQTGQVVVTAPPTVVATQPIAIETQRQIVAAAEAIATAAATASFTPPPPAPANPAPTTPESGTQEQQQQQQESSGQGGNSNQGGTQSGGTTQNSGTPAADSTTPSNTQPAGGNPANQPAGPSTPSTPTPPPPPPTLPIVVPPITQPPPVLTPGAGRNG